MLIMVGSIPFIVNAAAMVIWCSGKSTMQKENRVESQLYRKTRAL